MSRTSLCVTTETAVELENRLQSHVLYNSVISASKPYTGVLASRTPSTCSTGRPRSFVCIPPCSVSSNSDVGRQETRSSVDSDASFLRIPPLRLSACERPSVDAHSRINGCQAQQCNGFQPKAQVPCALWQVRGKRTRCFFPQLWSRHHIRWIIQAMVITLIGSLCVLIRPLDNAVFRGSGYYVVFSALAVLESNTGSCLRKSCGRMLGTIFGGFSGWAIFTLISWNTTKNVRQEWFPYVLILAAMLFLVPWGILRLNYSRLHYLCQYAAATGLMVFFLGYARNGNVLELAVTRTGAVAVGVTLNALVVLTVFPNHARPTLFSSLSEVYKALGEIIQPAITLSSSYLLSSNSSCCVSWYLNASHDADQHLINFSLQWSGMLKRLEHCQHLFTQETSLLEAARNELKLQPPHRLPSTYIVKAFSETRLLFFHIASFVYSLDSHLNRQPFSSSPVRLSSSPPHTVQMDPTLRPEASFLPNFRFSSDVPSPNPAPSMPIQSTPSDLTFQFHQTFLPLQHHLIQALSATLFAFSDYILQPMLSKRTLTQNALERTRQQLQAFHKARQSHQRFDPQCVRTEDGTRTLEDHICLIDLTATSLYHQLLRCYSAIAIL